MCMFRKFLYVVQLWHSNLYFWPLQLTIKCLILFINPLQYLIPTAPVPFEEFFFCSISIFWIGWLSIKELTSGRPLDGQRLCQICVITSTIFTTASSTATREDWSPSWWSWLTTGCFLSTLWQISEGLTGMSSNPLFFAAFGWWILRHFSNSLLLTLS